MVDVAKFGSSRIRLGLSGAALLMVGAAGGAFAAGEGRPTVEMAPAKAVTIASLPTQEGLVTVKGRVAEVYGDRFTVVDASGKTMVDAGREAGALAAGAPITIQGRFRHGQLRASFLVDASGTVEAVGRASRRPFLFRDRGGLHRDRGPEAQRDDQAGNQPALIARTDACSPGATTEPAPGAPSAK